MERLLTPDEVAQQLRVSLSMVRQKIFRRNWPCVRIGSRVFFRQADIDQIVQTGYSPARDSGHE